MNKPIRLQKFLAQCGIASRRKAEELIKAGRVTVDGHVITDMGILVNPQQQKICFDRKAVSPPERLVYFLLNKPKGYVTTLSDPQGRPIVTALLKDVHERVFPVGRLDFDTEGALLLTNDGDLAQKIQHPSNTTDKTYEARILGHLTREQIYRLETGILLDGKMTSPCAVHIKKNLAQHSIITITLHEGRKHQVKNMLKAVGHPVLQLKRTAYGRLSLGSLPVGSYKELGIQELKRIFL